MQTITEILNQLGNVVMLNSGDETRDFNVNIIPKHYTDKTKKVFTFKNKNRVYIENQYVNMHFLNFRFQYAINENTTTTELINTASGFVNKDLCASEAQGVYLTCGTKPLQAGFTLREYNITSNSNIFINVRMLGGSSDYRAYTHVKECELMVLRETRPLMSMQSKDLCVQSVDRNEDFEKLMYFIKKSIGPTLTFFTDDWVSTQTENMLITWTFAKKCDTISDYLSLTQMAYRLFTGKCLSITINNKINEIFLPTVQADTAGEVLATLRQCFNATEGVLESPLAKRIKNLYSYMLVHGFLEKMGITLSDELYSKFEQRQMLSSYGSKQSFFFAVLESALFICERTHQWYVTGDVSNFTHGITENTKWMKEANRILNLAPFVGNLESHGTNYFSYLSDLKDCIENGEAFNKFISRSSDVEPKLISSKLNSLKLLLNTEITRRAAQKERKQPMGVLVYGNSSIGKSSFTKMLFNYYGALFNLDRDDHYRYVRNPLDEYWSNFDSSKWCIQLDDIAFKNPSKSADIDSTLQDLLNVCNNVPYVPPQAALEDKGKTPVMAKLVIATTNCVDLNAQEYFWCPLAVRRRLPYVIKLKPKKTFLHPNRFFLDPSKIEIEEGTFPDLWVISVNKVVPVFEAGREFARLVEIASFTDVTEFLKHFGQACLAHENNQKNVMSNDDNMRQISVCSACLAPLPHENCVAVQGGNFIFPLVTSGISLMFQTFLTCGLTLFMLNYIAKWQIGRYLGVKAMNCIKDVQVQLEYFSKLKEKMQNNKMKVLGGVIASFTAVLAAIKIYESIKTKKDVKCEAKEPEIDVQGNTYGTEEKDLEQDARENVWYNSDIQLTRFDVPTASGSLVGASGDDIRNLFAKNCVCLRIKVPGETTTRVMRGIFAKGHLCVTNGHAFKKTGTTYSVEIIRDSSLIGVNGNLTTVLQRVDISFSETSDLCAFEVKSLPPFRDITKFWANETLPITSALELTKSENGSVTKNAIFALNLHDSFPVESMGSSYPIYLGHSTNETEVGMCGSIVVATTPKGPCIMGLHFLGKDHSIGVLKVTLTEIETLFSKLTALPIVQSGEAPNLNCESRTNAITEVHHKSVLRYLETAHLNVYGTFGGFRVRPRSRVCKTPLSDEFLNLYKVPNNYGAPKMSGWEPWRKNIVEMVKPFSNYNKKYLSTCVESFTQDILAGLPAGWEKELVVLSDKAAINGLPGVIYIDSINKSTSMGFPWCTTKKNFLVDDKCERYPEGKNFTQEVWDRVRIIEEKYKNNQRAYPIFTGHLKDEATALKKVAISKTRLFTGAPVDWSLVVRKNLLPFVRLLQKNKFVFEAGPGTVTQSAEWGIIYDYLTQHGVERIVAGDYGKFDKRMLSDFILAAFEIIYNIYRKAGYTEQEAAVILCIAEDTAFPLCNINGDLVEFFGTNPSGHPLTVIINSLVNSLYMRYCYMSLNPNHDVSSFKSHVNLFTYGDDNIMGVSLGAPFFNHPAIVEVLASIGVEYTMADKESESVPYVNISDVSFLKRRWLWNDDVKNWAAPLEEESLIKSLTMWVPSATIDCYNQMVAVISSANNEYFFYGREKFDEMHKIFEEILTRLPYSCYVNESTLPNYDQLVDRFNKAS